MVTVKNFINENGNVVPAVRAALKAKALEKYLPEVLATEATNEIGGYSIPVAKTEDGQTIYLHVSTSMSTILPHKAAKKAKAKETIAVEIPDLD